MSMSTRKLALDDQIRTLEERRGRLAVQRTVLTKKLNDLAAKDDETANDILRLKLNRECPLGTPTKKQRWLIVSWRTVVAALKSEPFGQGLQTEQLYLGVRYDLPNLKLGTFRSHLYRLVSDGLLVRRGSRWCLAEIKATKGGRSTTTA